MFSRLFFISLLFFSMSLAADETNFPFEDWVNSFHPVISEEEKENSPEVYIRMVNHSGVKTKIIITEQTIVPPNYKYVILEKIIFEPNEEKLFPLKLLNKGTTERTLDIIGLAETYGLTGTDIKIDFQSTNLYSIEIYTHLSNMQNENVPFIKARLLDQKDYPIFWWMDPEHLVH